MGNKKQFCAANMEKIDNRERCVRLSPLMSEHRHQWRTHRKHSAAGRDARISLWCLRRSDTSLSLNTWIQASEVLMMLGGRRWGGCVGGMKGVDVAAEGGGGVVVGGLGRGGRAQGDIIMLHPTDQPSTLGSCMRPPRLVK